jgi:hypothetical protein
MLIVAALAFGGVIGWLLLVSFTGISEFRKVASRVAHTNERWMSVDILDLSPRDLSIVDEQVTILRKALCIQGERLAFLGIIILLLGIFASLLYRRHPKRLGRQNTFPLTKLMVPTVVGDLEACVHRYGLSCPRFEYKPGLFQGHAFGLRGQEVLVLHGTPEIIEQSWKSVGRAIALHELAHIANGDIGDREKTLAVWKALMVLMSLAIVSLKLLGKTLAWATLVKVALMLIVVRGIGAGLIRFREFYADWRASLWDAGPALSWLLMMPEQKNGPWERWRWWWRTWVRWGDQIWWKAIAEMCDKLWCCLATLSRFHPRYAMRRKVLSDPAYLFRISPELSFFTGLVLTFVIVGIAPLVIEILAAMVSVVGLTFAWILRYVTSFSPGLMRDAAVVLSAVILYGAIPVALVSCIFFGISYLVTRTLGVQVQRRTVAKLAVGKLGVHSYLQLLAPASLFALGVEVGFAVTPISSFMPQALEVWAVVPLWVVGLTTVTWFWLAYVQCLSHFLFGCYFGASIPLKRQRTVDLASAILLTVVYWAILLTRITLLSLIMPSSKMNFSFGMTATENFFLGLIITAAGVLIAAAVSGLFVLFTWTLLWIGPMRRKRGCPACRAEIHSWISVGCNCGQCGSNMAPWLFVKNLDL